LIHCNALALGLNLHCCVNGRKRTRSSLTGPTKSVAKLVTWKSAQFLFSASFAAIGGKWLRAVLHNQSTCTRSWLCRGQCDQVGRHFEKMIQAFLRTTLL
jgi:hypothetical protein